MKGRFIALYVNMESILSRFQVITYNGVTVTINEDDSYINTSVMDSLMSSPINVLYLEYYVLLLTYMLGYAPYYELWNYDTRVDGVFLHPAIVEGVLRVNADPTILLNYMSIIVTYVSRVSIST